MNKKIYLIVPVCLLVLSACQFPGTKKVDKTEFVFSETPVSVFDESLNLDRDYIAHFRLDGSTESGEKSTYLTERKKMMDTYNSGNRSLNLIRGYIYLSSLEGDFSMRNKLEKDLCEFYPDACHVALVQVSVSGLVTDANNKPQSGVAIDVLGTKYSTTTNAQGKYSLDFEVQSPSVLRLRASTDKTMIDVKKIEIDDNMRKSLSTQKFEKNFTLVSPLETYSIDTVRKTVSGEKAEVTKTDIIITTPYTRYTIPFDSIVNGTTPYKGKLKALIFEFDRSSGSSLLDADAFDVIEGFASSLFVTYGMPYVIFVAEDGTRLDVLSTHPMHIATTLRERDNFMKTTLFDKLYMMAYDESQKQTDEYPINSKWLFDNGNLRLIPPFWVLDRSTGFWDNVGMRFTMTNSEAPYNIEAPFYTIFASTR